MTYFILGIAIGIFGSVVLGFTIMYVHKIRSLHLEGGEEPGTSCLGCDKRSLSPSGERCLRQFNGPGAQLYHTKIFFI